MNWAYHRTQPSYGQRQSASPRNKPAYARSQRAQNLVRLLSEVDVDLVAAALALTKETLRGLASDSGDWDSCAPHIRERLHMAGLPRNWFERTDASLRPENIKSLTSLAAESADKAPTRRSNFKKIVQHFEDNIDLLADALEVTTKSLYGISDGSLVFDDERFGHLNPKLVKAGFPDGWVDTPNAQIRDEWLQGLESLATDQYEAAFESEAHGVPVSIAPMTDDASAVRGTDSVMTEPYIAKQTPTAIIPEAPTEPVLEAFVAEQVPVTLDVSATDTWPALSDYSVNLPSLSENSQNSSYIDPEDIRNYTNPLLLKPLDRPDQLGIRVIRPVAPSPAAVVHRLPGNHMESTMSQPTEADSWYAAQKPKKLDMVSLDEGSAMDKLSPAKSDVSEVAGGDISVEDKTYSSVNQTEAPTTVPVTSSSESAEPGRGFASKLNLAKNAPVARVVSVAQVEVAPVTAAPMPTQENDSEPTANTSARKGGRRMGVSTDITKARVAALEQLLEPSRRGARAALWRYFLGKSLSHWANLKAGNSSFRDELARQVEVALELPTGWLDNPVMPPPTIAAWLLDAAVPLPGAEEKQNREPEVQEPVERGAQKADTAAPTAATEEPAPALQQEGIAALTPEPVMQTADTVVIAMPAAINPEPAIEVATEAPASVTPVFELKPEPVEAPAAAVEVVEPILAESYQTTQVVSDVPARTDARAITLTWTPCAQPTARSQASPAVQALKQVLESLGQSGTFTDADAYRFLVALTPKT